MGVPAAAFNPQDREADGIPAGFDSPLISAMINKAAAVSAGGASELADIQGIYNIIIKFLGNSIAI